MGPGTLTVLLRALDGYYEAHTGGMTADEALTLLETRNEVEAELEAHK